MEKHDLDIEIIWRKIHSSITESEEEQLNQWIDEHPENRKYYEKALLFYKKKPKTPPPSTEEAWAKVNRQILQTKPVSNADHKWFYVAAVSVLLIIFLVYSLLSPGTESTTPQQVAEIVPGSSKATLITSDGNTIKLEDNTFDLTFDSVAIQSDGEQLTYGRSSQKDLTYKKNTLIVPRGGKYALLLADGTRVTLNSETTLTYPVGFGNGKRVVRLEGEAFFDVAEDTDKPFEVVTGEQVVTVLGTQFTISSYDNSDNIATTLMEGRVKVSGLNTVHTEFLSPGEQALFNRSSGEINKQVIDIESHMGWVEDLFIFDHQNLGALMATLSRWYDVDVFFENEEVSKIRLTGEIERFENIERVLQLIEKTEVVEFEIKQRTIIVK